MAVSNQTVRPRHVRAAHRSSCQQELIERDQANQNLSMSRGGASEAPPLVEDLLATGGLWGRESQDIVKDAPLRPPTSMHLQAALHEP